MKNIDINKIYDIAIRGNGDCPSIIDICKNYNINTLNDFICKFKCITKRYNTLSYAENTVYHYLILILGIARLRDYDICSNNIKTKAILCLSGNNATKILQDFGCPDVNAFNAKTPFPMYSQYLTQGIETIIKNIIEEILNKPQEIAKHVIQNTLKAVPLIGFTLGIRSNLDSPIGLGKVPQDIINYALKMFV